VCVQPQDVGAAAAAAAGLPLVLAARGPHINTLCV
jgi:hypothetical protein